MERRIPDDAALADLAFSHLKLRLDQCENESAIFDQPQHRGNHEPKRDEGCIDHGDVDPVRHAAAVVMAEVCPFDADDPGILSEFPSELAVANIDRIDLHCPRLEEAVGEAAGGGPDVEGNQAPDGKAERIEGAPEFEATPADVRILFTPDPDFRIGGDRASRLVRRPIADKDRPGEDQSLRPLAALRQATRDKQAIQPDFWCFRICHQFACGVLGLEFLRFVIQDPRPTPSPGPRRRSPPHQSRTFAGAPSGWLEGRTHPGCRGVGRKRR